MEITLTSLFLVYLVGVIIAAIAFLILYKVVEPIEELTTDDYILGCKISLGSWLIVASLIIIGIFIVGVYCCEDEESLMKDKEESNG